VDQWFGIDQWISSGFICAIFAYATIFAGVALMCLLFLWDGPGGTRRQEEGWEAAERQLFLEEFV
jgi:hypothetical protein